MNKNSSEGEIITEEEVNCGYVPLRGFNAKFFKLRILVFNSILCQGLFHVQRSAQSFPNVASAVFIELLVASENLIDGLFRGYLKDVGVVGDHVDEFDGSRLFGKFSDDVLLVFPPLDFVVGFEVEVLPVGAVELLKPGFDVDLDSGLPGDRVEPESDVGASGLNQGARKWTLDVLLDEFGEIVDLAEEDDPAIIGGIVLGDLSESVESLFGEGRRQVLLDVVSVHWCGIELIRGKIV